MAQEALCLIADDLPAVELAANVCDRRIMEQEKVPMAEKIISLSDSEKSADCTSCRLPRGSYE
jgi:hypothetical protein